MQAITTSGWLAGSKSHLLGHVRMKCLAALPVVQACPLRQAIDNAF